MAKYHEKRLAAGKMNMKNFDPDNAGSIDRYANELGWQRIIQQINAAKKDKATTGSD